jgi:chromosome segregation ATPase
MGDLTTTVATVLGALITGGGLVAVVNALARRRTVKVDAAARLSDETLKWVNEFQEKAKEAEINAKEARTEAAGARREATEAHAQMRAIRAEAEWLAGQLQQLRRAILDPGASLERLRAMVGPDYPGNGLNS